MQRRNFFRAAAGGLAAALGVRAATPCLASSIDQCLRAYPWKQPPYEALTIPIPAADLKRLLERVAMIAGPRRRIWRDEQGQWHNEKVSNGYVIYTDGRRVDFKDDDDAT